MHVASFIPSSRPRLTTAVAAPHRLMFLGGVVTVLASMAWWAMELATVRFGWRLPQPPVPPGWAHAMLTQYGMLPLFVFGFLLTVFPRWLARPAVARVRYAQVFVLHFGGYLLALAGLFAQPRLLLIGFSSMSAALLLVLATLASMLLAAERRDRHACSCLAALAAGGVGLCAFTAFLAGASGAWAVLAIRLGTFAYLLPLYLTVCHRMIPFFSGNVVRAYRVVRPGWSLPVWWVLLLAHLGLQQADAYAWLWTADLPLAVVLAWHALAWQPWKASRPGLLAALHLAFAWVPVAFVLYALQSAVLAFDGRYMLGLAPLHALTIGFFGSMLVAMVTRVTQGHSGRPLDMGWAAWFGFAMLQMVAIARIVAAVEAHRGWWLLLAVTGWLLAFAPWALRSAWVYLTPRADGVDG